MEKEALSGSVNIRQERAFSLTSPIDGQEIPGTQNVFGIHTGKVPMIEPNPFETLRQIAGGYCLSRGLHVVANLAIADKLDETPRTAAELAVSAGSPPTVRGRGVRRNVAHTGLPVYAVSDPRTTPRGAG